MVVHLINKRLVHLDWMVAAARLVMRSGHRPTQMCIFSLSYILNKTI